MTLPGFPSRRPGDPGRPSEPGRQGEPEWPSAPDPSGDHRRSGDPGRPGDGYGGRPDPRDTRPYDLPPTGINEPRQPTGVHEGKEPRITVTRVAASRAKQLSQQAVTRIGNASRADGADKSGLTRLIWMNVVQTGGDAMIAVAPANTIFFAAATSQQRGNGDKARAVR